MTFNLDVTTDSKDTEIKDKCLAAVQKVLEEDGEYFGVDYEVGKEKSGLLSRDIPEEKEYTARERKIVVDGTIVYSFGKNGPGLSNEFLEIGSLIKALSKDNHIYLEDACIDACDDVYDFKFNIIPDKENEWMTHMFDRPAGEDVNPTNSINFPEELKYTRDGK